MSNYPFLAFALFLLAIAACIGQPTNDIDHYLDPFDPNPRFVVKNGHLVVLTGHNRDLTFRSSGTGRVMINGNDIAALRGQISSDASTGSIGGDTDVAPSLRQLVNSRVILAESRLQLRLQAMNATIQMLKKQNPLGPRKRLRNLTRRLTRLEQLLLKDECASNPCQHGGTCEDGFNRYICRCLDGFQGTNCEQDVDECSHYQGTELGCQNGGTCLNTMGSFHCLCPANYHGVRCTIEFNDCRNTSNHEICGYGVCFDMPRTNNGVSRYRCVCYQGYTKSMLAQANVESAPCDTDVDECATGENRCSKNPPVACFNTRSGYTCGPCPTGYSGDGYTCTASDLCLLNNGGCSISPRVQCTSTLGRVFCASCPPGFVGDGTFCNQIDGDICSSNNGGCSPQARCQANTALSATYRDCICPAGFTGNGIGSFGCTAVSGIDPSRQTCTNNPCQNSGTCMTFRGGVFCACPNGFTGTFCEKTVNVCNPNPCQNNGVCVEIQGSSSCICTNEYTGRNCEQARSLCGGELDSEAGMLAYPIANGSLYSHNASCFWVIKNSNAGGKVLNITFTKLNVENSPKCAFDFLEIYDGPSRDYKLVGHYCGNQLPNKNGVFISSFNAVMLRFQSDSSVSQDGFALNWITTEPTCGGLFTNRTHGMIESPGFPHHYPPRLDCHWEFVAEYGKRFQFVFTHMDIEPSGNCSFDYLEFQEGFSLEAKKGDTIARFCNWTSSSEFAVPPPITTSGSFANVHFHSDHGITGKGFQLLFHQVPGVCGGLLTGARGIFRPPSSAVTYSNGRTNLLYENNVYCDWLIRVLPEERILLRFLDFHLEQGAQVMTIGQRRPNYTCMFDYVEVFDGEAYNAPLRTRLCGTRRPREIISSGRFMRVKFRSDMSINYGGFTAEFKSLCGGTFTERTGIIESPNYPAPILSSKNCTYVIRAPMGHIVKLEIEQMDIEFDHRCLFDYILVNGQKYCGRYPPPPLYSMGDELAVTFVNDDTKPSRGFKARYEVIEVGCGGTLQQGQPMVAISAENIKANPFINQCFWEIRANRSFIVVAKFLHTEAVQSGEVRSRIASLRPTPCKFQSVYLMVNDTDGTLIKRFCPDELPPPISSTGNKLFITYVFRPPPQLSPPPPPRRTSPSNSSNTTTPTSPSYTFSPSFTDLQASFIAGLMSSIPDISKRNFYANYFFVKERNFCNRNLFGSTGVIRSPRFPRRYQPNRNCTWVIHVDNGLQIKLNFTVFQLEPQSEVNGQCYDYLEIRNGKRADSPLIGKFCGNGPMPDIASHSNYLFLRFITDPSMQNRGFKVYYEAIENGCGGVLTGESGSIESPDYPNSYFSNMNCEWQIRVSEGSTISIYIASLDIEVPANGRCLFDYIELFDGDSDGAQSMGRFCSLQGGTSKNAFSTSSNKIFIRFTSDATVNHGGFKLNYRTQCNRTLVGRYGVIESPNYPNPHPHNMNCNWHILGPMGNNLTVTLTALALETGIDCMFDHINISQVNRARPIPLSLASQIDSPLHPYNLTMARLLCGNYSGNLPAPIRLSTNEIVINFRSDESRSIDSGFRLEWGAVGCGGEYIERPKGIITSPGYPNPYPRDVECLWHIKAPEGRRVDLIVEDLDMEYSKMCTFDYVEILGGPDDKSPLISRLCNKISQQHISSVGNYMTIKLVSDISMARGGFKATFTTDSQGCGGRFTTESGTLTSPNFGNGNQYDQNSDCSYIIEAASHFDIELTLNSLEIPDRSNCSNSYLAIYDAASQVEGKLVAKVCNDMRNLNTTVFVSTGSTLYLRFKADGTNTGRGFNVTYRTICGKTIIVDDQTDFTVIRSANYPHIVNMDESCHYILKAAKPSDTVSVRFTHIQSFNLPSELYPRASNECSVSFLEFYEGKERLPHKRKLHYCTNSIPLPIISSGDTLLLVSYFTVFSALVSSVKSFCGGDFNAIEGYITNPGYPNSYPQNLECIWVLHASPGNRYILDFDDFDLEESDYCNGDYLEVRQGNSSGELFGEKRLCGSGKDNLPSLDSSYAGDIWIKFRTDEANVAKGFMLHFKTASTVMLSGDTGYLASPGYPNSFHFFNRTFTWSIAVSPNLYVKLNFEKLEMMGDAQFLGVCSIQLAVFNGLVDFSQMHPSALLRQGMTFYQMTALPEPKLTYCSSVIPAPFVSNNNVVSLMYTAPYFSHFPSRFLIRWSAINQTELNAFDEHGGGLPRDVNSTFSVFVEKGQSFTLLDDNFTQYDNDINWYFTTRSSMHFNISSSLLSFHPSSSCWFNKFTIYSWAESRKTWTVLKKLCNGFAKQVELPGTNLIRVHLQFSKTTDTGPIKPRYNMTLFPVCGGNFTEPSGTISADDAHDGHSSTYCEWLVKVRPGRTIEFTVEYFSVSYPGIRKCLSDYLEIRNGHASDSPLLVQPLCGLNSTSFVLPETSGNTAYLIFKSSRPNNNFRLHYKEVGLECGGELVLNSASDVAWFSSPEYPDSPSHDVTCEWIIRGPLGSGLQLSLVLEKFFPCDLNSTSLEVYRGGTDLAGLVSRSCMPAHNPNSILISSHITLVRYVLIKRDFHSKFNATIRADSCNREYYVSGRMANVVLPLGGPGKVNFGGATRCTLRLRTHTNFYITLNVSSLQLQGNNCTSGDVIEFRDSEGAPFYFKRFCAPKNSTDFSYQLASAQNELFISYERVNYQSTPAEVASLKKVGITFSVETKYRKCVRPINAKVFPTGVIRSPSYPNPVNHRLYCYWQIVGDIGTRIELHFSRFNFASTPLPANVSMQRCTKKIMVWRNLFTNRNMDSSYGCSREFPPDITSLSHTLSFNLMASELKAREGFVASYRSVPHNDSCSAFFDSPRGQVMSWNFDNLNYSGQVGCVWEMNLGVNQSATLLLDTYDVAGDCSNSSITAASITAEEVSYNFWGFTCITRENAPQTKGTKFILPIYRRPEDSKNPSIIFNFNRVMAGQSKGLRGEYFIQNCGGYFTDIEGEFTSPNYPSSYPTDTFCNWYFSLNAPREEPGFIGYRLTFSEFDIDDNCDAEYFMIKPRSERAVIQKLCKREGTPQPLYVGHNLVISFVSSRNLSTTGTLASPFSSSLRKFKFTLERAAHGCGGLLMSTSGYLQSPNYANLSNLFSTNKQYPSNAECVWLIKAIPDFHLVFDFNARFDIEDSANCSSDYLLFEEKRIKYVEDRQVEEWLPLKRLCGHKKPAQIVSQTNLVRATFRTNDKVIGDGFRVDYQETCGGLFQDESGTIFSPQYGEGTYGHDLSCVYLIQRAPHEYITIDWDEFDLEQSSSCIFDAITIYLGDHTNKSTPSYGPYCGTTLPPPLTSAGNITVVFRTDIFLSKRGFKFHFGVTTCGGNITDSGGIIVSPEITQETYKTCIWRITVPEEGNSVAVRFTELDLANEHCRVDCCNYIKIYDDFYEGNPISYMCVNNHEDLTFKSTGKKMKIIFRRGALESNKVARFKLEYWSTPGPKAGCGGIVSTAGAISSPDIDGDSNYESNLNCIWAISGFNRLTDQLTLEFERFDVEEGNSSDSCDKDYLAVYDGTSMHAPLLAKLCGRISIPEKILSMGESMLLHFVTNDNITGHGFRAHVAVVNRTCGGFLYPTEEKQELISPNYPNGYSLPTQCTWSLGVNYYFYYKRPIVLTFYDLDLNCSRGDYLQVRELRSSDYDTGPSSVITLCSSPTKLKVISNERMNLVMKADTTAHASGLTYDNQQFASGQMSSKSKDVYKGFRLMYHASLCNETIDGLDNGYVLNRHYPQGDYVHRDYVCFINISVPTDRQIALYFSSFSFYLCQYSNVTIYEGNSSLAKATFCNMQNAPSPIFSKSSNLTVTIRASYMVRSYDSSKIDSKVNRILYAFNYFSSFRTDGPPGCGGNLTGPRGTFSSPNYPDPLNEDRVCSWLITANGYHTLTLTFDFFQLSPGCRNNYVIIYDGEEDVEEKKLASFCMHDKPAAIVSQSNALRVKLYTILGNYDSGFKASYKVNTIEPQLRNRVVTSGTFRFFRYQNTFSHL